MKRTSVALGLLGLVYALALPCASAEICLQEDFSGTEFKGVNGVFMQGVNDLIRNDSSLKPFFIAGGALRSSPEGSTAGSDGATNPDADPPGVRSLLLTGDPAWDDVIITTHIRIDSQNTGAVSLIARARPKTKPEDPDTWYEFRYTTDFSEVMPDEEEAGIQAPDHEPNFRIMKVVNGKWTMLAESTEAQAESLPLISARGDQNESGATFRFRVVGAVLEGFISLDGTNFQKVLETRDDELKAGLIGLAHYNYNPVFDNLVVECQ